MESIVRDIHKFRLRRGQVKNLKEREI